MECSLVMFKSDGTRLDIPLTRPRMVIGRMTGCDIRISINRVSREHCEILNDEEGLRYRDLNSSNGVVHNGAKTKKGMLKAGDELVIGPVIFTVVIDGKPSKVTPIRTILDDGMEPEKADASQVGTLMGSPMSDLVGSGASGSAAPIAAEAEAEAEAEAPGSKILSSIDIGSSGVSPTPVATAERVAAIQAAKAQPKPQADELAAQKEGSSFAELAEEVDDSVAEDGFDFADDEGGEEEPAFVFE